MAVVLPLLFIGAGAYLVLSFVDHTLKSSGGSPQALAMVRADQAAVEARHAHRGRLVPDRPRGAGRLDRLLRPCHPARGPTGACTLYVNATRTDLGELAASRGLVLRGQEHRGRDRPPADRAGARPRRRPASRRGRVRLTSPLPCCPGQQPYLSVARPPRRPGTPRVLRQGRRPLSAKGKNVAIIGYGSQGHAQAQNLRDSGVEVIVPISRAPTTGKLAEKHGFKPCRAAEAAKQADVIQILTEDEVQASRLQERGRART